MGAGLTGLSEAIVSGLGLGPNPHLASCMPWIIGSFLFFTASHVKAKLVSDLVAPGAYSKWVEEQKAKRAAYAAKVARGEKPKSSEKGLEVVDWESRVSGTLHAVVVAPIALYCCLFEYSALMGGGVNPLQASTPAHVALMGTACGFFLYDILLCLRYFKVFGVEFLLHAVFCLATYGQCSVAPGGFTMGFYSAGPLLFETSTPFMHLRWWLIQTGNGSSPLMSVFQNLFGLTFLGIRHGFGTAVCFPGLFRELAGKSAETMALPVKLLFGANATLSIIMNTYWAWLIFKMAMRGGGKKKKDEKSKAN